MLASYNSLHSMHYQLLSCLLLLALSCHKKIDQPAPNLANCRIVRERYQVKWRPSVTNKKETVVVNGKPYDVMFARESTYHYDVQGRIVKEVHNMAPYATPSVPYTVTYSYSSGVIYRNSLSSKWNEQDTIIINRKGLLNSDGGFYYHYNDEDFMTHITLVSGDTRYLITYDTNKNAVKAQTLDPFEGRTQTNSYDLTKFALPNKYIFYGKRSINILTKSIYQIDQSSQFPVGVIYTINNYYNFDKYSRVSRQISIEEHKVPDQQYGQYIHPGGIGVTDYEYECP